MPPTKTLPVRSRVPAAMLLMLATCAAAHAVSPTTQVIQQGEALMKAGKPVEAAAVLRVAAQTNPDDYYLVYNLGIASYAAGQFQDAIDSFSEASMSPDKKIRAQALMQIGNAQFQLGRALVKNVNRVGASVAWERAIESYESALAVKSTSVTENNLKIARERLESVLMNLGDYWTDNAKQASRPESRIPELEKAVGAFERVTQVNPKNTEAAKKLAETRKMLAEQLRDHARELRVKADEIVDPKKEKEQEKLNTAANENYQKARENAPADKALEKEHDEFRKQAANALTDKAGQKMQEAMQPKEKPTMSDVKRRENALNETLAKVDKALSFDENNARAQALKEQAMKNLEEAHVTAGDQAKAAGDKNAETKPETAAGEFSEAMKDYQKALAINPDNAHAKEQLAKVEESLAKALTESGKKEMAQAAGQAPPPKPKGKGKGEPKPPKPGEGKGESPPPGESPGEQSPSELRENIGHLEKAAQSFAQAEALRPGENDASALQQQALDKLDAMRAALDLAQNKAPGAAGESKPGGESPPGDQPPGDQPPKPGEPGKTPPKQASMSPVKPVLSFSEIRSADKGEGLFRDLRQKRKIRDW